MTDLKPLSAEELNRIQKRRPLLLAPDVDRLIAQARRALELEAENAALDAAEKALRQIASEKHSVESHSTGVKQWFKTQGAQLASEALAAIRKHRGEK